MKKILGLLFLAFLVVSCSSDQTGVSNRSKGLEAAKNGQYEQAIEYYNIALNEQKDNKDKAGVLYSIGLCYGIMKDFDKEIEYYNKALELYPSSQTALFGLGKCYYDKKDLDNALKMFEQVTEINPEHEDAYYMLALVQKDLGNEEVAIINMKKAADY